MKKQDDDEPGGAAHQAAVTSINVIGKITKSGVSVCLRRKNPEKPSREYKLNYPTKIWNSFPESEKSKFLNNISFNFTAHLPQMEAGETDLIYNTPQPEIYSWIYHSFMRFLPSFEYLYEGKGYEIIPIFRKIINANIEFAPQVENGCKYPKTKEDNVVIPMTFGKDSLLTYLIAKKIGLKTTLVYFNEPTEKYAKKHKLKIIEVFVKEHKEEYHLVDNGIASLRAHGDGWFGWESTLTSYAILSLPIAHYYKSKYIIFSNEISCNDYFLSKENIKVMFDYKQSHQATIELSNATKHISGEKVFCTNFLEGLYEIAIVGILKHIFPSSLKYLMSCWAEDDYAKNGRWCEHCSKCARLYIFLVANGVDPQVVGFKNSMLNKDKMHLFSIFDNDSSNTNVTYDSLGLNKDEQLLAFYLAAIRGDKSPLIEIFGKSKEFKEVEKSFDKLMNKYYGLHPENMIPRKWKSKINKIFLEGIKKSGKEINEFL